MISPSFDLKKISTKHNLTRTLHSKTRLMQGNSVSIMAGDREPGTPMSPASPYRREKTASYKKAVSDTERFLESVSVNMDGLVDRMYQNEYSIEEVQMQLKSVAKYCNIYRKKSSAYKNGIISLITNYENSNDDDKGEQLVKDLKDLVARASPKGKFNDMLSYANLELHGRSHILRKGSTGSIPDTPISIRKAPTTTLSGGTAKYDNYLIHEQILEVQEDLEEFSFQKNKREKKIRKKTLPRTYGSQSSTPNIEKLDEMDNKDQIYPSKIIKLSSIRKDDTNLTLQLSQNQQSSNKVVERSSLDSTVNSIKKVPLLRKIKKSMGDLLTLKKIDEVVNNTNLEKQVDEKSGKKINARTSNDYANILTGALRSISSGGTSKLKILKPSNWRTEIPIKPSTSTLKASIKPLPPPNHSRATHTKNRIKFVRDTQTGKPADDLKQSTDRMLVMCDQSSSDGRPPSVYDL